MIHNFFMKRFKNYLVLFMIPSLMLFVFLLLMMTAAQIRTMQDTSASSLENVNDTFDLITANAFHPQDFMTLNPQLSLSLRKILLFSTSSYSDYVFLNSMKTILSSATKSYPFIDSIYLYLDNYDTFFSSENGICSLKKYSDNSWYELYQNLPEDSSAYITQRTIPATSNTEAVEVITIFQRMTYLGGTIVVNLPVDTFLDNIETAVPSWENYLLILNSEQEILLSNGMGDQALQGTHMDISSTSSWITWNHRLYLYSKHYNEDYDITFVMLTPLHTILQNIGKGMSLPLLLILVNCFLVLALAYTTTRKNFSQIQYVIDLFSNAEKGILPQAGEATQPIESEYDLIMNNVIRLFLNTTFLNSQLAEQQYKKQVAELTALQLQINPHFMVNTLQTLNFEVQKLTHYKPLAVTHIIDNLSDILRYSLTDSSIPVTLADELYHIRKYVEIQKYRFPDSFLVYEDMEEELTRYPFHRLILQPLVENSISHGILPLAGSRKGVIKIRILERKKHLMVSVVDNGVGMSREKLLQLRGCLSSGISAGCIGLDNVNKRLLIHYGADSALSILSHEGMGCCITFRIPVIIL